MSHRYRCLMLGAGAMGTRWIRDVWQPFRDRMEFVGLVDANPAALSEAGDWLGLPPTTRFTEAHDGEGDHLATVGRNAGTPSAASGHITRGIMGHTSS